MNKDCLCRSSNGHIGRGCIGCDGERGRDFGAVQSLQVESVSVMSSDPTLSQVIVRLPDNAGNSTELKLKVILRGQTSNVGTIRIALP